MLPGSETLPLAILLIVGALVLIGAAAAVGVYVYRVRQRSPRRPNTAGPAQPPPVEDRPLAAPGERPDRR